MASYHIATYDDNLLADSVGEITTVLFALDRVLGVVYVGRSSCHGVLCAVPKSV